MNKLLALFVLCAITFSVKAQQAKPVYKSYGKVDKEDLEMKACDFEKDANAEVLFAKGTYYNNILSRHVRIKVFNAAGVNEGSIRIPFFNYSTLYGIDGIDDFKAETINIEGDKVVVTPVDRKSIYTKRVNKFLSVLSVAFPDVKPGSIIEYKFNIMSGPTWYFQSNLPCRYSEIDATFSGLTTFRLIPHVRQAFTKNVGGPNDPYQDKILTNIPSLPDEPYMGSRLGNLEHMEYLGVNPHFSSWKMIGQLLMEYVDFGGQFNRSLTGEDEIIKQAKSLKSNDEKISFIFNEVKNNMKWNNEANFATTVDGTPSAWNKKTGNSAEINLILYHLLKKSGITANPLIVSEKEYGKINPTNPDLFSFNNTLVYVPIDTTNIDSPKYYVLDATNKYNLYNEIPKDYLNECALRIDKDNYESKIIFMENPDPILHTIYLDAVISPNGKMNGNAHLSSYGYNKVDDVTLFKTKGEQKFKEYLTDNDNGLKIASLKMNDMEVDSLPLTQDINFAFDLPGADDNYIYFTLNMFFSPHKNPFLNETRYTDVDFGYHDRTLFSGVFKIPAGYKVDALPKDISMIMPDTSITFKRTINEQEGTIVVRYTIYHKKTMYFQESYPEFYQFFRKMYEMLNEQIVLKKS
jgi:hypothetical protein